MFLQKVLEFGSLPLAREAMEKIMKIKVGHGSTLKLVRVSRRHSSILVLEFEMPDNVSPLNKWAYFGVVRRALRGISITKDHDWKDSATSIISGGELSIYTGTCEGECDLEPFKTEEANVTPIQTDSEVLLFLSPSDIQSSTISEEAINNLPGKFIGVQRLLSPVLTHQKVA